MTEQPAYERQYDVEGCEEKILLQIFEPKPAEKNSWVCTYRLVAPHLGWDSGLYPMMGDDSLGAFADALTKITIELRSLSRRSGSTVSFMGDEDLDLIDRDYY